MSAPSQLRSLLLCAFVGVSLSACDNPSQGAKGSARTAASAAAPQPETTTPVAPDGETPADVKHCLLVSGDKNSSCVEYLSSPKPVGELEASCLARKADRTEFDAGPCPTTASVGYCELKVSGSHIRNHFYGASAASFQRGCEVGGGKFVHVE